MRTSLRATTLYKSLTQYMATAIAEGFCEGEGASEQEQLTAWQWLHDKGLAYKMQGFFGRTCQNLIDQKLIHA